jgi:hypothetical protein
MFLYHVNKMDGLHSYFSRISELLERERGRERERERKRERETD